MNYIEAMKHGLIAIERLDQDYIFESSQRPRYFDDAKAALRKAIEEAEKQEPVAWMYKTSEGGIRITTRDQRPIENAWPDFEKSKPLYTSPPQPSQSIDYESAVKEMLAIIHGDGGHYTEEHGLKKSIEDAHKRLAHYRAAQKIDMGAEQPPHQPRKSGTA